MGKVGSIINSEIIRLAKSEMRKVSIPLKRDVRLLKNTVSQLRKSVLTLERFTAQKQKELAKCRGACYMTPIDGVRSISYDPPGALEMTPLQK